MAEERLSISVVVIAFNEEKHIRECIESLAGIDYPRQLHEVLIVDNASTDATGQVVDEAIKGLSHMRLKVNPEPGIAQSRNFGLREAKHDFIAFTDADCTVEPGWLSALERAMVEGRREEPKLAGVGGPNIAPKNTTLFREAVAVSVTTFWGSHGSVQGLVLDKRIYVEHLPTLNVLFDGALLIEQGWFDTGQGNISEDVELSYRLVWRGFKLLYDPKAVVRHRWREDAWSWVKNIHNYGKGRTWLMKRDSRFIKPHVLAPIGLLTVTAAAFFPTGLPLFVLPLCYLFLTALVAIYACLKARKPGFVPLVFAIYVMTHYAYGVGQLRGLLTRRGSGLR